MALSNSLLDSESMLLVSVDSIAVTADITNKISRQLEQKFGIPRSQLVLSSTHSHTSPHLANGLTNLFQTQLSREEVDAIQRNTDRIVERMLTTIDLAMQDRQPGSLTLGGDQATFAVNRRVLKSGVWSGFGVQADGPVDHRVRVLRATDANGKLRGAVFMYACHCTTLGGDFNQVSGDWAGLAATELEKQNPNVTVLATIGCGADANPNPRSTYQDAQAHAAEIVAAVSRAFAGQQTPLNHFPVGHFGYAGLVPELPTREYLKEMSTDARAVNQRWSEAMTKTWNERGRLPESYPAPIHTWQFGDDLTWVFLGGEVVIDYQMKLEKMLPGKNVWVAAYTDDVFAYVASQRMRAEGGYEVDFSMVYYMQPGRWSSGTEDLLLRRVREVLDDNASDEKPSDADASWKSIQIPSEFMVDRMACEPQVADPINIAFGHDGRVWVVEMADYPLGNTSGGRIRWLIDSDGDGSLDQSQVFLDGLSYPTSVTPWRDGVIVIAAPQVILARDTDGDGKADSRETLLVGIHEANPQHRASGFEMGLDGWLHFGAGDKTEQLESKRAKQTFNVSKCDVAWNPDTGEIHATTGETQFCPARDEFDRWYGNSNSKPIYQYVIDERYVERRSPNSSLQRNLLDPPVAPPVFPASRTADRFNDIYAHNRFTSACSSIICRSPGLGESMRGAAIVCEPVHNLVARYQVTSDGAATKGLRFSDDEKLDWFASKDSWSRPVRAVNAPDGTIWIVDMVRHVIEHPQWIPMAWQQRYDVRSGEALGRLYRVRRRDYQPSLLPNVASMNGEQLIESLVSNNGALRDLAQFQFLWRSSAERQSLIPIIRERALASTDPAVRLQCFATLVAGGLATSDDVASAIADRDPRVVPFAIRSSESFIEKHPDLIRAIANRTNDELGPEVDLQILLSLGALGKLAAGDEATKIPIASIIARHLTDPWIVRAIPLVHDSLIPSTIEAVMVAIDAAQDFSTDQWSELETCIQRLLNRTSMESKQLWMSRYFSDNTNASNQELSAAKLLLLGGMASSTKTSNRAGNQGLFANLSIVESTRSKILDSNIESKLRSRFINLLGHGLGSVDIELDMLAKLLGPDQPPEVQESAMAAIRRIDDPRAADVLLAKWTSMTADARRNVCATLLQRKPWIEKLVLALEDSSIKVRDLDAATIQQLRSKGDRSLMARCEKILGRPANLDRARLVDDYLGRLNASTDRMRGEKLYLQHCAACHLAKPSKPIVGPPLENLKHWTTDQWLTAVLDPNRNLEPKYHQYSVLTTNGQVFSGVIESQTSSAVVLAMSDGSRREILLTDIETLKDMGISLMPEGIETSLSPDQLSDLLDFVRHERDKP